MADVVTSEGLVLAVTDASGNVYPFACSKNATLSISRDFLELAPRTNGVFREYLANRSSFSVSGDGLIKISQSYMQPITFFDSFIKGSDSEFIGYLDMIDTSGNYKVYTFNCILQDLRLNSSTGQLSTYSYTIQGTGPITEISEVDSDTVTASYIPARDPASYKLVGVGIEGVWYYNYIVTPAGGGLYDILIGSQFNGKTAKAVYISI